MTDEAPPQDSETPERIPSFDKRRLPTTLPIAAGVLLGVLLVAIILIFAVRSFLNRESAGIPLEITRVSGPSPLEPLPPPPFAEIDGSPVPLSIPTLLEVGGELFTVMTVNPGDRDIWTALYPQPENASWAYGTVINYILALSSTPSSQEMIDGLRPGSSLVLHLASGVQLTFSASNVQAPPEDSSSILSQSRPGLTLVLLSRDGPEQVVRASFDSATEPTTGQDARANVGQAVNAGDVTLTVTEGHTEDTGSSQPDGTIAYLVEFSITNTGSAALSPETFLMDLQDNVGNRYLVSAVASAVGRSGPLSGAIQPGETRQASAGYIIPNTVSGPSLTWIFNPNPTSELRVLITVPYTPQASVPSFPEVRVLEAFLGESQTTLHVVVEVQNTGTTPVTVSADDISLTSSAGPGELQMAAPPFPWTIEGGSTREVELQFVRPGSGTAAVTILGYTFEVSGLP